MNEREMIKQAIAKDMPDCNNILLICEQYNTSGKNLLNKRIAVYLSTILIMICGVGTAFAYNSLIGVGNITEENIVQLINNGTTMSEETNIEFQNMRDSQEMTWEQICMNSMKPFNLVCENNEYMLKDVYIQPGYGVALQKADEMGFQLKKGDVLNCKIILDLSRMNIKGTSVGVEFGYILNGEYHVVEDVLGSDFLFQIDADEEGEYFPCILNRSSANLIIDKGTIN